MILLDTDHLSILTDARHQYHTGLVTRLRSAHDYVVIPIVSVEEQLRAWLAHIHRTRDVRNHIYPYDRLIQLFKTIEARDIARWTALSADEFARLRNARIRIGTQDSKIASIALAYDAFVAVGQLAGFSASAGLAS